MILFFFLNRLQRNIHDTFALLIVYKERGLVDVWYKLTDCLIENNCSVKTNETQRQNSLCAHSGYGFHQKHSLPLFLFGSESPACVCFGVGVCGLIQCGYEAGRVESNSA